uniref:Uncharacterized protein n=1 Tax=Cajanus cajan TaxID=3821 RepID=A0A151S4E9_CAJCA|nr:hypothetical protein KK1_028550 [Cajanus cajan]
MQVSMNNQKNTEASIKNLEVQVGQLAKQLADMSKGPFSSNTKTNPKEYFQAITTRSGKVVGSDIGVSGDNEGGDNKEENSKLKAVEEEIEKNEGESNKNEGVDSEKIKEKNHLDLSFPGKSFNLELNSNTCWPGWKFLFKIFLSWYILALCL